MHAAYILQTDIIMFEEYNIVYTRMTNSQIVLLEIRQFYSVFAFSSLYHYTFAVYRSCWINHETPASNVHDMIINIQTH